MGSILQRRNGTMIEIGIHTHCYNDLEPFYRAQKMMNNFKAKCEISGFDVEFVAVPVKISKDRYIKGDSINRYDIAIRGFLPMKINITKNEIVGVDDIWCRFEDFYNKSVYNIVASLVMAIIITDPGLNCHCFQTYVKFNGKEYDRKCFLKYELPFEAYRNNRQLFTRELTLQETWDWICQSTSLLGRHPRSPIYFAALTYIAAREYPEALFYSVVGLNYIYVQETDGICSRMQHRITKVFPWVSKEDIKRLYKMRSKFAHGEYVLQLRCLYDEVLDDSDELEKYALLGVALLLESIRMMVKEKRTRLDSSLFV